MKPSDPLLWAALQLREQLVQLRQAAATTLARPMQPVLAYDEAVRSSWQRLQLAEARGWHLAAQRLQDTLRCEAQSLRCSTDAVLAYLSHGAHPVPPLGDLLAELRQLGKEFETLDVRPSHGLIAVTTASITLEDVYLGPFEIQLHVPRLARSPNVGAFDIVALDPQPAARDDRVTHPHVQDKVLCAGDAAVPIAMAVADGRIADALCLIRSVLSTYNSGSPYVALEDWTGVACGGCGYVVGDDNRYACETCGDDVCSECISTCDDCGESSCRDCLEHVDDSDDLLCRHCREVRQESDLSVPASEPAVTISV